MAKRKKKKGNVFAWIIIILALVVIGYFLYPRVYPGIKNFFTKPPAEAPSDVHVLENHPLTGFTWVSDLDGAMMELKSNGSFTVDFPGVDDRRKIFGHFKMDGERIIFVNHPSTAICVGEEGVYKYELKDGNLNFEIISDGCKHRREHMEMGWFKL
ncbi:MAG: hypothetical protein K9G58_02535 [Bacteroidales bacterium]|nr:hypothetical protein [Bacteroidales bacterium]MCF8386974.1 hypothetical protein [Bacteroidales bacterium]MCF8397015.1 hypothetical protein [Bacteroidales bacterium]